MEVELDGPLVGRTVEGAGLRHLPGLFLVEVNRDETVLPVVSPELVLRGGDRLVLAGITDSVLDLQNIRGLRPAAGQTFKLDAPRNERRFFEAVVAAGAPVAERTVRESAFRSHYRAVVIAVAREGRRVQDKIGNIRLAAGDTLLLEADAGWERRYRHSRDFLLVRPVDEIGPLRHEKAWMAWTILALVVLAATLELTPLVAAVLLGAGAMVLTRCCTGNVARLSVDLPVIIVIACAFGFGKAMQVSGAGAMVGRTVLAVAGENPLAVLAAVYGATTLLTAVITNNAAAALMFPIAAGVAAESGMNLLPLAVAIAMAASAEFSTPIGYQTNLMVYGPGGYRFSDYLRFGLPLNLLAATATLVVVPRVWPLT
jgi:di/tricarboxylate transporter